MADLKSDFEVLDYIELRPERQRVERGKLEAAGELIDADKSMAKFKRESLDEQLIDSRFQRRISRVESRIATATRRGENTTELESKINQIYTEWDEAIAAFEAADKKTTK